MFAASSVDALRGQSKPLYRLTIDDVRLDYFCNIGDRHATVPDRSGIDHDTRTVLALLKAAGFVRSHSVVESTRGQLLLEGELKLSLPVRIAATTRVLGWTIVGADENVMFKSRHAQDHPSSSSFVGEGR